MREQLGEPSDVNGMEKLMLGVFKSHHWVGAKMEGMLSDWADRTYEGFAEEVQVRQPVSPSFVTAPLSVRW